MLSAPRRSGIIAGYAVGALLRWALTGTVVTIAALIAGMNVDGSGIQLIGLLGLGIAMNLVAALWACGVAMFLRTEQAGALIQMPVFVLLFLAPVYVPVPLLDRLDPRRRQRSIPRHAGARGRPRPAGRLAGQGRAGVSRLLVAGGIMAAFARRAWLRPRRPADTPVHTWITESLNPGLGGGSVSAWKTCQSACGSVSSANQQTGCSWPFRWYLRSATSRSARSRVMRT